MKKLFILFSLSILAGCNHINNSDFSYQGRLILGHEEHSFTPCGSDNVYWVESENRDSYTRLENNYYELTQEPYEPVFAKFNGVVKEPLKDGFASDYNALFIYEESFHMEKYDGQCD